MPAINLPQPSGTLRVDCETRPEMPSSDARALNAQLLALLVECRDEKRDWMAWYRGVREDYAPPAQP